MKPNPGASVREERLSEVLAAYLEAVDAGWAPDREAFLARYPDLAPDLKAYFHSLDAFAHVAGSLPRSPSAPGPARSGPGPSAEVPTPHERSTPTPATVAEDRCLFGDYELLQEIAHGGMGVVFKARQPSLNRLVALKMIKTGELASTEEVRRFRVEAESAARLDHPNIVPIYEVGEFDGHHYFTMKLIEGGNLHEHLPHLAQDPRAAVRLLATVTRAVHHAHQRGILHRDLKPGNILIDAQGQPHVADFGLAKVLPVEGAAVGEPSSSPRTETPVSPGAPASCIAGTPGYAAPEQSAGPTAVLTTAADVYSLGAILYKILTEKTPAECLTTATTLPDKEQGAVPETPRRFNPRVDRDLEAVCMKCLAPRPEERYGSAQVLAEELERWLRREPVQARRRSWLARAWRTLYRNALLSVVMALAGFGLATWAVMPYLNDPDRPLKKLERELARGESVTLIGETGRPKWSRWFQSEDAILESVDTDKPYSFTTLSEGRLILLKSPKRSHYRFAAEIKHDEAVKFSETGLFFGHTPLGAGHSWFELAFADKGDAANRLPNPNSSWVMLNLKRVIEEKSRVLKSSRGTEVYKPFAPAEAHYPDKPTWRHLAVDVSPEKIICFWEGQPIGELSEGRWREHGKELAMDVQPTPPPHFHFNPEGPLGVYVYRGKASFRRVVVEPLP